MVRKQRLDYHGFYELLRENLAGYRGDFDEIVLLAPDFFRLLTNLLEDSRVPAEARRLINAAIAYFVAPYDVEPEEVYGPRGYLDDLYLCAYVVRELRSLLPDSVLEEAWEAEFDLLPTADAVYDKAGAALGEKTDSVLRYVGLRGRGKE
ncbi:MAG: YkvA family protein [Nitrospiraceae bacterium]